MPYGMLNGLRNGIRIGIPIGIRSGSGGEWGVIVLAGIGLRSNGLWLTDYVGAGEGVGEKLM